MTISAFTVFCDDIRKEESGKDILIGVYGSDLVVDKLPATIPLSLWINIRGVKEGLFRAKITVSNGDSNQQTIIEAGGEISNGHLPAIFSFGQIPVHLSASGPLVVNLMFDEEEVDAGQLMIAYQEP
jgi:hypothetical protein